MSASNQIPEAGKPMRKQGNVDDEFQNPDVSNIHTKVSLQLLDIVWHLNKKCVPKNLKNSTTEESRTTCTICIDSKKSHKNITLTEIFHLNTNL